jgi:hypothetical protein
MFCASCQEIFRKQEFWDVVHYKKVDCGGYNHSKYLESIREGSRKSCQICTMLCLHFDTQLENQLYGLNLGYTYYFFADEYSKPSRFIQFYWDGKWDEHRAYFDIEDEEGL